MASHANGIGGPAPGLLRGRGIASHGLTELEASRLVTEHAVLETHGLMHPVEFRVLGMTLIAFGIPLCTQGRRGPSKEYRDNDHKKLALH